MTATKATATDIAILIDSQLYVDLYRTQTGRKQLALLKEQREYVFVTAQIVNEVERRKLEAAVEFFGKQCCKSEITGSQLPDHLFDDSGDTVKKIRAKQAAASKAIKQANEQLGNAIIETLRRVSRSEDPVSKGLATLFERAVMHTDEELRRARERKERGIPPGKHKDPIGDELNWEQFLSFARGRKRLWILSKDSDYCLKHGNEVLPNPVLYHELRQLGRPAPEIFFFQNIAEGIQHFLNLTGLPAKKRLTDEEVQEIKKEEAALPPLRRRSNRAVFDTFFRAAGITNARIVANQRERRRRAGILRVLSQPTAQTEMPPDVMGNSNVISGSSSSQAPPPEQE